MCADSILSFPSVFLSPLLYLLVCLVWYKIIQSSHLHATFSTLFFSTSPPCNTSLLHLLISPSIALLCGCVVGCLPLCTPPPPLPFLVKERMRLEREEATRLLEEETEVRHSSTAGPQTNFSVCAKWQFSHKHHRTAATGILPCYLSLDFQRK